MAIIIETDEIKNKQDNGQSTCPPVDKDIMEQIMVDPMGCLNDDKFMLEYVVNNGINCSLLCEALGVYQLRIEIEGIEYKMFYSDPHPMFKHSDVMFRTEKFLKYMHGPLLAKQELEKELEKESLPVNGFKPGMSPLFQKV